MLIKVVDVKGKERWINAVYVKSLMPRGDGQTEIEVSGWAAKVRVAQALDEVARVINQAMPSAMMASAEALLASIEGEARQAEAHQAAAATVVIG
jgi:hypothetical protein